MYLYTYIYIHMYIYIYGSWPKTRGRRTCTSKLRGFLLTRSLRALTRTYATASFRASKTSLAYAYLTRMLREPYAPRVLTVGSTPTCHMITYHIKLHHITSHHITSHLIKSHHTTSHHIISHHITSHHFTSHHTTSHHITSHQITSHHIIS